jgi:hypothetical protein
MSEPPRAPRHTNDRELAARSSACVVDLDVVVDFDVDFDGDVDVDPRALTARSATASSLLSRGDCSCRRASMFAGHVHVAVAVKVHADDHDHDHVKINEHVGPLAHDLEAALALGVGGLAAAAFEALQGDAAHQGVGGVLEGLGGGVVG